MTCLGARSTGFRFPLAWRSWCWWVACSAWLLTSSSARAYTVASSVSTGCHERMTAAALRAIRLELREAASLPADKNERALIADLEFKLDGDMRDLGAATLIASVRDNDLKGRHSADLKQLALVHGDPDSQQEHCLRGPDQKEPNGTAAAVSDCRAFIRERVAQALDGLDAAGAPDPTKRTDLKLYLTFRHRVTASLPTYYVRMGQAIHALEDSFTHAFRTPDGLQITVALDWLDEAAKDLVEAEDGPPHAGELDQCDDADELRTQRHQLAQEAATAALRATLDPAKSRDQKMAAVEEVLNHYLSYAPGCTFDNDWCDAPERKYKTKTLGCGASPQGRSPSTLMWTWALGLLLVLRRLGRRSERKVASLFLAVCLGSAQLLSSGVVLAQSSPGEDAKEEPVNEHRPPPPTTTPVAEPGPKDPSKLALGGYLGVGVSVDYGGLALQAAGRLRVSTNWTVGLDGEWNPWLSSVSLKTNSSAMRAGAFNGYGTLIFRMPLAYEQFNLRATGNFGFSRLLMDLYGAPKGSTGIYMAISPLGLEWKMSRAFFLVINPISIAVPIPQLKGVPLAYTQYRFTVGIEFYTR